MDHKIIKIVVSAMLILVISGCGGGNAGTETASPSDPIITGDSRLKPYLGSWKWADDGTEIYITSNTYFENNFDLTEIDENQLKFNFNGSIYYLIRNGVKRVSLKGTINSLSSNTQRSLEISSRSLSAAGGISVILQNVNDENINSDVETDSQGNFTDNTLPAGTYDVSASDGTNTVEAQITIDENSEDIGSLLLANGSLHNFKTELILNDDFIYSDGATYQGIVRVHNISQVDGIGLNYTVTLSDSKLKSFTVDNVVGSIPAQQYKDIPISLSFNPFLLNEKTISINTTIRDINYNEWSDDLRFTAYRKKQRLNFRSEQSNIRGYISLPNKKQRNINLSSGYIDIPSTLGNDYYIVLANPDLSNETSYSIGYESPAADLSSFNDTWCN